MPHTLSSESPRRRQVKLFDARVRHLALMTTPAKRSALGTLSNTPGRPTGAPKSSQKRSSRSRRADLAEAPAKAPLRSAESMRRERGLGTWCNFIFGADAAAPGSTAVLSGSALSLHQVEQQRQEAVLRARVALLLRGPELGPLLCKVAQQVEESFLRVRPPLNLTADVGKRDALLNLLGCYHPAWLVRRPS